MSGKSKIWFIDSITGKWSTTGFKTLEGVKRFNKYREPKRIIDTEIYLILYVKDDEEILIYTTMQPTRKNQIEEEYTPRTKPNEMLKLEIEKFKKESEGFSERLKFAENGGYRKALTALEEFIESRKKLIR